MAGGSQCISGRGHGANALQAAEDNHFMHSSTASTSGQAGGSVTHKALQEFAGLYHELTEVPLNA